MQFKQAKLVLILLVILINIMANSVTQAAGTEYLFEGTELPANLEYPKDATYTVRFTKEIVQNTNNATILIPNNYTNIVTLIFEKNVTGTKTIYINISQSKSYGSTRIIFKGNIDVNIVIGCDALSGNYGERNPNMIFFQAYGDVTKDIYIHSQGHDGSPGASGGNGSDIQVCFLRNVKGKVTITSKGGTKGAVYTSPGVGGLITAYFKGKIENILGSKPILLKSNNRVDNQSQDGLGSDITAYTTYQEDLDTIEISTIAKKTKQSSGFSSTNPEKNIVQTQQFTSSSYRDTADGFSGVPDFYVDKTKTTSLDTTFTYTYPTGITPLTFTGSVFGAITLVPDLQIAKYKICSPDSIYTFEEETAYNLPLPGITKSLPLSELYKKLNKPDVNFVNCEAQYNVTIIDAFTGKTYDYIWARNFINVTQEIPEVSLLVLDKNEGVNGDYIPPYGTDKKYINMDPTIKVTFPGFAINDYSKTYIINHIKLFIEYQKTATETVKIECLSPEYDAANTLVYQISVSLMNDELKTGKPFSIQVEYYNPFSGLYTGTSAKSVLLVLDVNVPGIQIVKNSNFDTVNFKIIDSGFADTMERIDANGTVTTNYTVTDGMIRNAYFIAVLSDQEGLTSDVLTTDFIARNCEVYIDDKVFEGMITVSPIAGYVSTVQKAIWRITLQYNGAMINYFDDRKIKIQLKNIRDITNNSAGIGERIVFTPATQFRVNSSATPSILEKELTITELSYMNDTETEYRMAMVLDPTMIRCTHYNAKLLIKSNGSIVVDTTYENYAAQAKLFLANIPISNSEVTITYATKSKNGFITFGESFTIKDAEIQQYLGKVIDLAPDFRVQKDIYLNWPKSPLYASKSIYIPKGCTLHIQGYTRLQFTLPIANEGLLVEDEKKIIVDGTLIIDGQPDSGSGKYPYITGTDMDGSSTNPAYFGGIYVLKGGNIFLQNIAISYASAALFFEDTNGITFATSSTSGDQFKTAYAAVIDDITSVYINSITMSQCKIALVLYKTSTDSAYEAVYTAKVKTVLEQLFVKASTASQPAIQLLDTTSTAELKIVAVLSLGLKEWYQTLKTDIQSALYPIIAPYFVFSDQL